MPEDMGKGNPDAQQDESLIQAVMQRELGPIFEAIGSRLRDLDEDLGEAKDLLYKFVESLVGAADNSKRNMLSGEISSKYGKDIEPFEGFYKDTQGKGFSESILEELMGDNAPGDDQRDEWIKGRLGEAKAKYGKYVGIKDEPAAPAEAAAEAEAPGGEAMAEKAEEAPKVEQKELEFEAGTPEKEDAISRLMNQVKEVGGKKHKLSAKSE